jgi:hypothetical protein
MNPAAEAVFGVFRGKDDAGLASVERGFDLGGIIADG